MEICYYKSEKRNFGDDLNPYIIESLIPNYQNFKDDTIIYFIGTILFDGFAGEKNIKDFKTKNKIVIGSGIRFINKPLKIDKTWDVRFLRGPLSSLALLKDSKSFITDPAYLVTELPIFKSLPRIKKYKISVMPHFLSLDKFNWSKICEKFNVNFISPSESNLDQTLTEISQSDFLITEAMHGAIIADALRVPWKRFKCFSHLYEGEMVSEFKWSDWLFSMNLEHSFYTLGYNKIIKNIDKHFNVPFINFIRSHDIETGIEFLINNGDYQLSEEKLLNEKMNELLEQIYLLKK